MPFGSVWPATSGDAATSAYTCALTVTAPAFALHAGGGPAAAAAESSTDFLEASSGQAMQPLQALTKKASIRENGDYEEGNLATHFVRPKAPTVLSPALASMLETTLVVAASAGVGGPADFESAVKADLQAIYETPTGRKMLESLQASGKRIYINYGKKNGAEFPYGVWEPAFYSEKDGRTPGQGVALKIEYNPTREKVGEDEWNSRPPGLGLAHELIHAEQAAYGRMRRGMTDNPGVMNTNNPSIPTKAHIFELETVGVPPHDTYPFSENKIRAEWNPPQTTRTRY